MYLNFIAVADATGLAVVGVSAGTSGWSAAAAWLDQWQWPLCGVIFIACLIIFVVTARQVSREQRQKSVGPYRRKKGSDLTADHAEISTK